jgi:hypothetical protein
VAESNQTTSIDHVESPRVEPPGDVRLQLAALEGWANNRAMQPEMRLRAALQALALWRKLYPDPEGD